MAGAFAGARRGRGRDRRTGDRPARPHGARERADGRRRGRVVRRRSSSSTSPFPIVVAVAVVFGLIGGSVRPSLFEVGVGRELEERASASVVGATRRARSELVAEPHGADRGPRRRGSFPIAAVALWRQERGHARRHGVVLLEGRAGHVRRRLRRARLRRPGGGGDVRLAPARSDDGGPRARRIHAGSVDHGRSSSSASSGRISTPAGSRRSSPGILGATVVGVGDVRAVLPVDLPRRRRTIERIRGNVRLASALQTVMAAVVGVIANLAVTFADRDAVPGGADRVGSSAASSRSRCWTEVDPFAVGGRRSWRSWVCGATGGRSCR